MKNIAIKAPSLTPKTGKSGVEIPSSVVKGILRALQKDGRCRIKGLGRFLVRHYPPKKIFGPKKGLAVTVPARKKVVFRPDRQLTISLNH